MKPKDHCAGVRNMLDSVSDREILDELIKRCHCRLSESITSRDDENLRDALYNAGKLLIKRFPIL